MAIHEREAFLSFLPDPRSLCQEKPGGRARGFLGDRGRSTPINLVANRKPEFRT